MCEPIHFSSLNYSINPWMKPGKINKEKSLKEWNNLVSLYKSLDIEVEILKQMPDVPDMVFSTDQGIVHGGNLLLSRFKHKQRKNESKHYEKWFQKNGYKVKTLPANLHLEGNGELFFWNDLIFLGVGFRSNKSVAKAISRFFGKEVVVIEIVDPYFFHLDVGFFPLNSNTIFYYPPAYSQKSQKKLKEIVPNLIEFTKTEAFGFCGNSVATDHHVVYQEGNYSFDNKLRHLGYKPDPVDLGEFVKSGGGAHCLTNILEETYES